MAVSPKVSASTVGASLSTMVIGILNVHVFPHGMAPDVEGLVSAAVVAVTTFAAGWFAREAAPLAKKLEADAEPVVRAAEQAYSQIEQAAPTVEAVAEALAPAHVTVPTAVAQ